MPNGHDRTWIRLCGAIEGFRSRYKKWPTRVRLPEAAIEDLREVIFSDSSFARINARVLLVASEALFVAEDDENHFYNYGDEGFVDPVPDVSARDWLRVDPDRAGADE